MPRDWGRLPRLLYLMLPLWLGGCGEPTAHGPISLNVLSGGDQEGVPGQELPQPIVVRVTDGDSPVAGVLINFVVVQGGGHVFAGAALTNAQGEARERWTLGAEGENVVEARGVDQTTGEAIVYARITAYAVTAPVTVATLTAYPYPLLRLLDSALDVTPFVYAADASGNRVLNPPLTLTVPGPFEVTGNLVKAEGEAFAQVTITSGPASALLEAHFLVDLTRIRWRMSFRCHQSFRAVGPGSALADSAFFVVVSDSVKHENLGTLGTDTRLYLWSTGTTTFFYSDGRVITAPAQLDPMRGHLIFIQSVGKVMYYHPEGNSSTPLQEGTSDGALPPTYTGGNLCPAGYRQFSPVVLEPAM